MAVKKKNNAVEADSNSEQDKPEAKPGFDSYLVSWAGGDGRAIPQLTCHSASSLTPTISAVGSMPFHSSLQSLLGLPSHS